MKRMWNWRSLAAAVWLVAVVLTLLWMPDLEQLVRDKGQVELPDSVQSDLAHRLLDQMNDSEGSYEILAVFYSGGSAALDQEQEQEIARLLQGLEEQAGRLGIREMTTHLDSDEVARQLTSEDGTTILAQLSVDADTGTVAEVTERLREALQSEKVQTYLTGTELVIEDFVHSTQEGIKRTELIAVIFILVVLILVFRSPLIPLVSLTTVGLSYLVSLGIVAQLVQHVDFPFSNFTQVFLVVVLFGIGTDYNILLYNRFRAELAQTGDVLEAVRRTFRTAGQTVIYSGLAVFIGFLALFLAEFKIYRAASAVAIGVAVMILVLYTLNPFFMALLGKWLFWPVRRIEGHGDSRMWELFSRQAVWRPLLFVTIAVAVCIPFFLQYSGELNYNDLLEMDEGYGSVQGIRVIEEHFPAGFSSPANLVLRADRALDNPDDLQTLDQLAEQISRVEGVAAVYTVTRPEGEPIEELYLSDQSQVLSSGLGEAAEGLGQLHEGISAAQAQFQGGEQGLGSLAQLLQGTDRAREGAMALGQALARLTEGLEEGQLGARQLHEGLGQLHQHVGELSFAVSQLSSGYVQLSSGLGSFAQAFAAASQAIEGAIRGYEQIEAALGSLVQSQPTLGQAPQLQAALTVAATGKQQLAEVSAQLQQLLPGYQQALDSLEQANLSLQQVGDALGQLHQGVGQLREGAASLETGLGEGAYGAGQMAARSQELAAGLGLLRDGQQQLVAGLDGLQEQMSQLRSGLQEGAEGLQQIGEGLEEAQQYLEQLSRSGAGRTFYIPAEVLEGEEFRQAVEMYMSEDRQMVRMMVILEENPYTQEAMEVIRHLDAQAKAALRGTPLADAVVAISGKSSINADLQEISSGDFVRTAVLMLAGISIVLLWITRSFWQTVYILAALILTYGAALGITEWLTQSFLGVEQMGWNVPFFSFIMLVTLGVDYSIFLMRLYNEYRQSQQMSDAEAIVQASRRIGKVVISAAVILGGTFAALIPSGILTLVEIALVVIIGLVFLCLVMMPLFIPGVISLMERLRGASGGSVTLNP